MDGRFKGHLVRFEKLVAVLETALATADLGRATKAAAEPVNESETAG